MKHRYRTPIEGGFPLAAVVLLVTTVAALLACIDLPRVREELASTAWTAEQAIGMVIAVVLGAIVGAVLGLFRRRRLSGFFLGGAVGGLATVVIVPLSLAPANVWQCLAAGSVLLLTSIVVRAGAR